MIKREALSGRELRTVQFSEEQVNNLSINYGTVNKACISYKTMKRQTFKIKRNEPSVNKAKSSPYLFLQQVIMTHNYILL